MVTFTVDVTAALTYTNINGGGFTPGFDTVELNGLYNGLNNNFWTWSSSSYPVQYQMTQVGASTSAVYQITLPVNQGQPLNLTYDYGIDGQALEPNGNHHRYIRSQPNYSMPTDVFGSPATAETSFGNLTVSNVSNQVSISWLGRTGVSLQSTASLTPPIVWTPLPLTDGSNLTVNQGPGNMPPVGYATTNLPVTGGAMFFELIGPQ